MELNKATKYELIKKVENLEEWERLETSIDGVAITKPPEFNDKQLVYAVVMCKKQGIFVKSLAEFQKLREIFLNPEFEALMKCLDEYYPNKKDKLQLMFEEEE